jgi:selenocysteine lyase/cysteine desulfurase
MSAPEPFDFDATHLLLAPDARRYTQSTISYASAAGLTAAIDQVLDSGLDNIERAASDLAHLLVGELRPSGWHPLRELGDPSASDHIISLSHEGIDMRQVTRHPRTVSIVAGGCGGRLRISLAPYNNEDDVADLVRALCQI